MQRGTKLALKFRANLYLNLHYVLERYQIRDLPKQLYLEVSTFHCQL